MVKKIKSALVERSSTEKLTKEELLKAKALLEKSLKMAENGEFDEVWKSVPTQREQFFTNTRKNLERIKSQLDQFPVGPN